VFDGLCVYVQCVFVYRSVIRIVRSSSQNVMKDMASAHDASSMFQTLQSITASGCFHMDTDTQCKLETFLLLFTHLRSISILHQTTYFHCSNAHSLIVHHRTDREVLLTTELEDYADRTRLASSPRRTASVVEGSFNRRRRSTSLILEKIS
jgi:hypothetical protein